MHPRCAITLGESTRVAFHDLYNEVYLGSRVIHLPRLVLNLAQGLAVSCFLKEITNT